MRERSLRIVSGSICEEALVASIKEYTHLRSAALLRKRRGSGNKCAEKIEGVSTSANCHFSYRLFPVFFRFFKFQYQM